MLGSAGGGGDGVTVIVVDLGNGCAGAVGDGHLLAKSGNVGQGGISDSGFLQQCPDSASAVIVIVLLDKAYRGIVLVNVLGSLVIAQELAPDSRVLIFR